MLETIWWGNLRGPHNSLHMGGAKMEGRLGRPRAREASKAAPPSLPPLGSKRTTSIKVNEVAIRNQIGSSLA